MICYSYQTHEVKMTTTERSNHSPLNFNIYVKINFFVFVFVRAFLYFNFKNVINYKAVSKLIDVINEMLKTYKSYKPYKPYKH